MAKNLNYNATGSTCNSNDNANCTTYGRFYDWTTAKSACPSGWHLPSKDEWSTLIDFVGGTAKAGAKLKATSGWQVGIIVTSGTDNYGFAALPSGWGSPNGGFLQESAGAHYWGGSDYVISAPFIYAYSLIVSHNDYTESEYELEDAFLSVRCVQN